MIRLLRHLPLLACCLVVALCTVSCGDEPHGPRPGSHDNDTPADTIQPVDTTANDTASNDTTGTDTCRLTISITTPRHYGYMGQTMQLAAVTNIPPSSPVTWTSSRTDVATVDNDGVVTFANVRENGRAVISACADGVTATLPLDCRCWSVALHDGTIWARPDLPVAHPGDTLELTITDSDLHPIDDDGFNAASCQWNHSSRNADVTAVIKPVMSPSAVNGWHSCYVIEPTATDGSIVTIKASLGSAASSLSILIRNQ